MVDPVDEVGGVELRRLVALRQRRRVRVPAAGDDDYRENDE
jgi:hypothetical protein